MDEVPADVLPGELSLSDILPDDALPAVPLVALRMRRSLRRLWISGQVQGVGFRPFVYRLACELGVGGWVCNTGAGVRIEAEASPDVLDLFVRGLREQAPPLARIDSFELEADEPATAASRDFVIRASLEGESGAAQGSGPASGRLLISPDVAPCADCLADMHRQGDRRQAYPFTNCTNCGPRFSITRSIPYDRATTSMSCFPLCPECAREYADPADRRFHAQPNACPVCGPRLRLYGAHGGASRMLLEEGPGALAGLAEALRQGQIAAVKGVGGFLLACDARNIQAILELRKRKQRPHKPLAVMVADLAAARSVAEIDADTAACLGGMARPIVLCRRHRLPASSPCALPVELAPDSDEIGIMLPSSPLHVALFDLLEASRGEGPAPVLVMTSGNAPGEPLCLGNREALAKLGPFADVLLMHDRDIVTRVDDSVLRVLDGVGFATGADMASDTAPSRSALSLSALSQSALSQSVWSPSVQFIRRARGFVPAPIALQAAGPPLLAWGADLKNTVCALRGDQAFVGQHVGDVVHVAAHGFMRESARHLLDILRIRPQAMVCDAHPDSIARLAAEEAAAEAGVPLYPVQHHRAHIYSVLAEHPGCEPALGLALDGVGYAPPDERGCALWGGELLVVYPEQPELDCRPGSLRPFPLPGGDEAVRKIWRIALGLNLLGQREPLYTRPDAPAIEGLVKAGLAPLTSSCGRLFDAVSALLGLGDVITYEGQGAIRLEQCAALSSRDALVLADEDMQTPLRFLDAGLLELDSVALFAELSAGVAEGRSARELARLFHLRLACGLVEMCVHAAERRGIRRVALGGGVLHNRIVATVLPYLLHKRGLTPLMSRQLPPGDGGLSLGQAWWLRCHMAGRA